MIRLSDIKLKSVQVEWIFLVFLLIAVLLGTISCSSTEKENKNRSSQTVAVNQKQTNSPKSYPKADGGESRPILPADKYNGKAKTAYLAAKEVPDILDKIFCYCYCEDNPRFLHKSLKTCFVTEHGAFCDICQDQAIMAYQLHKKGMSVQEIVNMENKTFYKPKSH